MKVMIPVQFDNPSSNIFQITLYLMSYVQICQSTGCRCVNKGSIVSRKSSSSGRRMVEFCAERK